MPDIYSHSIDGCLADLIGDGGLSADALDTALEAGWQVWSAMRADLADGDFPPLAIAAQDDDLAAVRAAADRLAATCDTVAIIGVGGSSLGAEALCALAVEPRVRLRFLDNPDPHALARFRAECDPSRTGAVIISKSGGTAETLAMAATVIPVLAAARPGVDVADYACAICEDTDNPLRRLADHWGVPVIEHPADIGGRFSVFSAVGLLPAALAGLDIEAVRAGAGDALELNLRGEDAANVPALAGAACALALLRSHGVRTSVLMPYGDALAPLARWYRQLWAESLGKNGLGTTPVDARGSVDQHSQLQLWLDGPADKIFTLITHDLAGRGERVPPDLAALAGAEYLAGHTTGDLLAAEQEATIESLCAHGRPVRRISVARVDEAALGALMAHFMLETVTTAFMLGVDPFGQPAVEDGKERARRRLADGGGGVPT
jgi:glucose-6-phosphate isomerase